MFTISYPMQHPEGDRVVSDVRGCPHPGNAELVDRHGEEDEVRRRNHEHVKHPESAAVHVIGVGILVAMSSGHHLGDFNFGNMYLFTAF